MTTAVELLADQLMTPNEAAAYLRVAPATLAGWRSDPTRAPLMGPPPHVRLGGRRGVVRYRANDLRLWVERRLVA